MGDLLQDLADLAQRAEVNPLKWVRWTPPQLAFLRSYAGWKLLRTGTQFGKTWAGAAETIFRCLGEHPYRAVRRRPIEAWVICSSWSQSIAIQAKIWELLPKDKIDPGTEFSAKNGFKGTQKAVVFKNGSILRIKTAGQDALDLESATIHYAWIDEPLKHQGIWGALTSRVRRTGGEIGLTMTPASAGNLDYLRELCEAGSMEDLHFRMEPENFIPEGAVEPLKTEKGVPMDQAWVDAEIAKTLPHQRAVRCHGEWEYAATDQALDAFDRRQHVVDIMAAGVLPAEVELSSGIDYGEDALRTCGVLVYLDHSGEHPRIFVMSEYAPKTPTTVDMDADGLLHMLALAGDRWPDLDYVWADKRYQGRSTRKNARVLLEAVAKRLKVSGELRPKIRVAKRGIQRGHFWPSVRWLHEAMIRPGHFYVDERCAWLIEALETWDGTEKHIGKDIIDALRYSTRHIWGRSGRPAVSSVVKRQF
jgi:hypothetical protein